MAKNKRQTLYAIPFLALVFCFWCGPAPCDGATKSLLNFITLLPGSTKTVDVDQTGLFPLGCPQFFVAVLGTGTLGISLKKDDVSGDVLFMLGRAVSSAGSRAIFRTGTSKNMIDQIVEIGDGGSPYGFVWLYCGVVFSINNPTYSYAVRLSFEP